MAQNQENPAEQLQARLDAYREAGVSRVKIGLTDMDGVLRGKYVSLETMGQICDYLAEKYHLSPAALPGPSWARC